MTNEEWQETITKISEAPDFPPIFPRERNFINPAWCRIFGARFAWKLARKLPRWIGKRYTKEDEKIFAKRVWALKLPEFYTREGSIGSYIDTNDFKRGRNKNGG